MNLIRVPGREWGKRSKREMAGVHWEITAPFTLALHTGPVDFGFYDGLRTHQQQEQYLATGRSKSLDSYHLTGDAGDGVPWVDGAYSWEWEHIYPMALSIKRAFAFLGIPGRWGGVWDRALHQLGDDLEAEVAAYVARRKALGKPAFPDGAHFQRLTR